MSAVGPPAPLSSAAAIPAYSPLGKPVVGNENPQEKDRPLPPVQQGEQAEKSRNRVESKPKAQRREQQPDEQSEDALTEQADADGAPVAAAAPANTFSNSVPAIRVLPSGHPDHPAGRAALDAFNQPVIDPGLLLDQRV